MKDIPDYEGLYAITEDGRVWSYPKEWKCGHNTIRRHAGKWLKPFLRGRKRCQYLAVELNNKPYGIHQLVALAYLPNPFNLPEVNHKDGDKYNNHVDNLEWCTQLQNAQHAQRTGLNKQFYGEAHGGHKLSTQQVEEIRSKKTQGFTLKQLSAEYHSSISNLSYICREETRIYG